MKTDLYQSYGHMTWKCHSWKGLLTFSSIFRSSVNQSQRGISTCLTFHCCFYPQFVAQVVKNPPAMQETWVQSPGWDDPLEKGKATHSSILAWRIPWTVWSMGLQRVRHDWMTFTFTFSTFMENLFSFGVNAAHWFSSPSRSPTVTHFRSVKPGLRLPYSRIPSQWFWCLF